MQICICMVSVEYKKLGDIATYINGYAFKPEQRGSEGLPIIRIQDLTGNAYDLGYYNGDYPKKVELNDGDVLISWSASLGVYLWDRGKALLNQHIFKVVFDKVEIDKFYFMYAVEYNLDKMSLKTHGATMKHITKKDFDNVVIPYPDLDYQKKISYRLTSLKGIIKKYQEQLVLLDELIKARFVEMFGEIEDCGKWKSKIWNEVVTIQNGRDYKKVLVSDGGYPVVGTGGEIARSSGYLCPENTIVVGRKGSINNPMLMREKFWNVDTAFGVIPNCDYLHYQYFYYFCKFYNFMKLNKATTLPSTTKADLLKIRINIPPLELQNQFASFVEEVDKSRSRIQKSLEASKELFDSLMQEYFG